MKKIVVILGVLLLAGCGGGGSSGGVVAPTVRPMVTNNLRVFLSGDNIQYSLTGTISTGAVTTTVTGTAAASFTTKSSPADPTGIVRSVESDSIIGTLSGGTPINTNNMTYYTQDAAGNYNLYGDNSGLNNTSNWVTVPATGFVTRIKSPIVAPSSRTVSVTQQNGDVTTATITVIGKATVTTGMGTFEAYKIQTDSTIVWAAGGTDVSTKIRYIVPSIGVIKSTGNVYSTDALGAVTTSKFTMIASTTNIPF